MWRLVYPLRYFRLLNPEKRRLDIWPTMIIASVVTGLYTLLPEAPFFDPNGFLDKLLTLTSCLTEFYVAALVDNATFTHPDLDKTITAGAIALVGKDSDGNKIREALSRREFACYVFGYLAYLCLIFSVLCAGAISILQTTIAIITGWREPIYPFCVNNFDLIRTVLIFLYSSMAAHLLVAISLGLYYLMDRLYRRDQIVVTKNQKLVQVRHRSFSALLSRTPGPSPFSSMKMTPAAVSSGL